MLSDNAKPGRMLKQHGHTAAAAGSESEEPVRGIDGLGLGQRIKKGVRSGTFGYFGSYIVSQTELLLLCQ